MFLENLHQKNQRWAQQGRTRIRTVVERGKTANQLHVNGKTYVDFASNDYLGLNQHPHITAELACAVQRYGLGSAASAWVTGYSKEHARLEAQFAEWLQVDRALLFNSGYHANLGILSALVGRSDCVFSDKLCHASLLAGIALSRAHHVRYRHNDFEHVQQLAKQRRPHLLVTESIFSMEGDVAPIHDLFALAEQYQCGLLIDDAHGIGVLGATGAGIKEYCALSAHPLMCFILPLGKAFNGCGAVVAGSHTVIETLVQFAKTYHYTTALPPAFCVALQSALQVIQKETWRREQLQANILFFTHYAQAKGLTRSSAEISPIQPLCVTDNQQLRQLQEELAEQGFYVAAIRAPTVPDQRPRLRISLNSLHTTDQIKSLIDAIVRVHSL
jgi:8-amino-7-oxononanoate synthase